MPPVLQIKFSWIITGGGLKTGVKCLVELRADQRSKNRRPSAPNFKTLFKNTVYLKEKMNS